MTICILKTAMRPTKAPSHHCLTLSSTPPVCPSPIPHTLPSSHRLRACEFHALLPNTATVLRLQSIPGIPASSSFTLVSKSSQLSRIRLCNPIAGSALYLSASYFFYQHLYVDANLHDLKK